MFFASSRRLKAAMSSVRKAMWPRSSGLTMWLVRKATPRSLVDLGLAVGHEGDRGGVALRGVACAVQRRLGLQVQNRAVERLHARNILRAQVQVVELDLHAVPPGAGGKLSHGSWRADSKRFSGLEWRALPRCLATVIRGARPCCWSIAAIPGRRTSPRRCLRNSRTSRR